MWEKPIALTFNVGKARQEEKQVGRELDLGDRRTVSHLTPVADLIRKGSLHTKVDGVCVNNTVKDP